MRPEPGRKYFNHMAKHSPGAWHRHWLLSSGMYIKTSDPDAYRNSGWQVVGEAGPELVKLPSQHDAARRALRAACLDEMEDMPHPADGMESLTCHCGRIACRHHQEEP